MDIPNFPIEGNPQLHINGYPQMMEILNFPTDGYPQFPNKGKSQTSQLMDISQLREILNFPIDGYPQFPSWELPNQGSYDAVFEHDLTNITLVYHIVSW